MEFSRQEYWSGLPSPSPGDLPNLGIELESPALQVYFFFFYHLSHQGSPILNMVPIKNKQKRNCFWRSQLVSTNSTQISRDSTTTWKIKTSTYEERLLYPLPQMEKNRVNQSHHNLYKGELTVLVTSPIFQYDENQNKKIKTPKNK